MALKDTSLVVTVRPHDISPFTVNSTLKKFGVFEGHDIELVEYLSMILGFQYVFKIVPDNDWGRLDAQTGKWTGLMGQIINYEADMTLSGIIMSEERKRDFDFSLPFMTFGNSILYVKPKHLSFSAMSFIRPFSPYVWLCTGALVIVVTILIAFGESLAIKDLGHKYNGYNNATKSLMEAFWSCLTVFLKQATVRLYSSATKITILTSSLLILILSSLLGATLVSRRVTRDWDNSIKGLDDLLNQETVKFGIHAAAAWQFKDSSLPLHRKVWDKMVDFNKTQHVFFHTSDEGIEKVMKGNFAMFLQSCTIQMLLSNDCQLAQVGGLLNRRHYAIIFRKGFQHLELFNVALIKLQQAGFQRYLERKWWKSDEPCREIPKDEPQPIDFGNVNGLFIILIASSIAAHIYLLVEVILERRRTGKL